MKIISKILEENPIEQLTLKSNIFEYIFINNLDQFFSDEFAPIISEIILKTESILYLDLSKNSFTEKGIKIISDALKENKTIEILNLHGSFFLNSKFNFQKTP